MSGIELALVDALGAGSSLALFGWRLGGVNGDSGALGFAGSATVRGGNVPSAHAQSASPIRTTMAATSQRMTIATLARVDFSRVAYTPS
jgi:hypothetical protein